MHINQKHPVRQNGFAPMQIIISIFLGVVIVGGIVGGILYFSKFDIKSGISKCGDGVCEVSEKSKCVQDCQNEKTDKDSKAENAANEEASLEDINIHQLATGKNFGDILKLFNPVIDESNRRLYVVGSKTTNVGVVDLDKDELVDVFDIGVPGGFLIFNNQKLYSFDFGVNKCYEIDVVNKKISETSISTCTTLAPGKDKDKSVKFGKYSFKETGYQSFKDGTTGFTTNWSQDLNGAYGIIEIYNASNVKVGKIVHGPDALYFSIDQKTGKLYTTNTGDGSISVFDLNKLESTNFCKDNSCFVKEIDIGNSVDEVVADSKNNIYIRNRLGGSVIYKYNLDKKVLDVINNENHVSGGIGMWPTDMELSKDEKRLYVLSHYGALIDIVDTSTIKVKNKIKFTTSLKPRTDSISAMAVDKTRDRIYAAWPELGVIGVGDGLNEKVLGMIDLTEYGFDKSKAANAGPGLINIDVDEKTGKLYVYFSNKLIVFNGSDFSKENEIAVLLSAKGGESILKVNGDKGKVYLRNKVFDVNTLKEIGTISRGSKVAAFDNENDFVYVGELIKTTPAFKNNLMIYKYANDISDKDWRVDGVGEIANTFFDFKKNVFYVADFLYGIIRVYDLEK